MRYRKKQLASLFLALALLLTACGGGKASAATMHLIKTEGKVMVEDAEGKSVQLMENLGLFSGYEVDTRSESYAWINLDEVKLTKMDQDSEIAVHKDGKKLEIEVKSGSLFFNVTEPLASDETMEICASTMLVGIRGTCGWVTLSEEGDRLSVWLLEGKVRCEADGEKETVRAGEMAVMTEDGEITVEKFSAADVPAFVLEEIEDDDDLLEAILDDSGIDVLNPEDPAVTTALAQYRTIVSQAGTYFDDDYYNSDITTTSYCYALVQMQTEYQVPALVLGADVVDLWGGEMLYTLIFQYDPNSQTVIGTEGGPTEGVASAGGFRGTLEMAGDRNGILATSYSSGTGEGSVERVTLEGTSLRYDTIWSGNVFEDSDIFDGISGGAGVESLPIAWHSIDDLSGLDSWTPEAPAQPVQPDTLPEAGPLASYVGTYTPYETFHSGYGGGERLRDVTLSEDGVVTGGGTSWFTLDSSGATPASVEPQADGTIVIRFSANEYYTLYPAGTAVQYYESSTDSSNINLKYSYFDGGVMEIVYYKLP